MKITPELAQEWLTTKNKRNRLVKGFIVEQISRDIKAEVVDDSNKRSRKTIFCNLYRNNGTQESNMMSNSLYVVEQLLRRNNIKIFHTSDDVANYLNLFCKGAE